MIKLFSSACIEASREETWKHLSQIENIDLWSESVLSASCDGSLSRGKGAERTCKLKGNVTITEKWIDWNEGHSFAYIAFNLPLIKTARNKWSVVAQNGKTLLTTEAEIKFKGGIFGKLLEPIMVMMARRMSSDALVAFKFLVENGHPYKGNHSSLPRAPLTC